MHLSFFSALLPLRRVLFEATCLMPGVVGEGIEASLPGLIPSNIYLKEPFFKNIGDERS